MQSQKRAFGEKTFLNYVSYWVKFLQFCLCCRMVALPASGETLMCFLQSVANRVKSFQTVRAYSSAVRKLHQLVGVTLRGFSYYPLTLMMDGIKRGCQHIKQQARPITPKLLLIIHNRLDFSKEDDCIFWCVCLFAFYLLFRKSNLLPDKQFSFNPDMQLKWEDLVFTGKNIVVGIRWAKNHQIGRDLMTYPLPILHNSPLCPLQALRNLRRFYKHQPHHHLFRRSSAASFTYSQFQRKLRVVLAAGGVPEPHQYSSHSFRRGGATFAFLAGVPPQVIKTLGGWKSEVYQQYLYLPLEVRIAASELVKLRILHLKYCY